MTERVPPFEGDEETREALDRRYLAVPYGERALAKALGARWDTEAKSWFVDGVADVSRLSRWLPKGATAQRRVTDPREELAEALSEMGFKLAGVLPIMDGTPQRAPVWGDRNGERAGFYIAHLDGRPAGYAKNHRTGVEITWKARGHVMGDDERAMLRARAAERRNERHEARERRYGETATRIASLLERLPEATAATPYMRHKEIGGHRGVYLDENGATVVPATDADGKVWTAQFIAPGGEKRFARGGRKRGCFHAVGGLSHLASAEAIIVAEGYATAATVSQLLSRTVVAAFDAGNLEPVARALHAAYPSKPVLIVADDDRAQEASRGENPGQQKALAAATAVSGRAVSPIFAPGEQESDPRGFSDFNDLATKSALGRDAARRQLEVAYRGTVAEHERRRDRRPAHDLALGLGARQIRK